MDYQTLVTNLMKPGDQILESLTSHKVNLLHAAIGITGEVNELLIGVYNGDDENVVEELGDIEFYIEAACQGIQYTPGKTTGTEDEDPMFHLLEASNDFLDLTKKYVIYNSEKVDRTDLQVCLFRVRTHLTDVYGLLQVERNDAIEYNKNKLSKRYDGGTYSDANAEARKDKS